MVKSSLGGNLTSGLAPCLRREARFNEYRDEHSRRHETTIWNIVHLRPLCAPLGLEIAVEVETDKFAEPPVCERSAT